MTAVGRVIFLVRNPLLSQTLTMKKRKQISGSFLTLLFAVSAISAQSVDIGVVGSYDQNSFGSPAVDGYELNFTYEDDNAAIATNSGDGFSLDGGSAKSYDDVDSSSLEFYGFGSTTRSDVLNEVQGKDYTATFQRDGVSANYSSTVSNPLPTALNQAFFIDSVTPSGTAAYWNGLGQLVLDANNDYTFNFNTYTSQPDYMSLELFGPTLDLMQESIRDASDAPITSYSINAGDLTEGHLYDVGLFVAEIGASPGGTLTDGTGSISLEAMSYQGEFTAIEMIAVPELSFSALGLGLMALATACRRRRPQIRK